MTPRLDDIGVEHIGEAAYLGLRRSHANVPFATHCWGCLVPAAWLLPAKKDRPRLVCEFCPMNGFLGAPDRVWAVIGLGEEIATWDYATVAAMSQRLAAVGARVTGKDAWTVGHYGRNKQEREVLTTALPCLVCGLPSGPIRRTVSGEPYLTHPRGCRSRLFLRTDTVLARYAGWAVLRRTAEEDPWPRWVKAGRQVWASWLDPTSSMPTTPPLLAAPAPGPEPFNAPLDALVAESTNEDTP